MGRLKEGMKEKAHQRTIRISSYEFDDSHFLVEGELTDHRLREYYLISGEKCDPGTIHHMVIRLLIESNTMKIVDYELELKAVPRDVCRELQGSLQPILGLSIARGFTLKVKGLLGGVKGCTHLVTLLIEMGPAALQGLWSIKTQKKADMASLKDMARMKQFRDTLLNTCYVWREDGPTYSKLKKTLESID